VIGKAADAGNFATRPPFPGDGNAEHIQIVQIGVAFGGGGPADNASHGRQASSPAPKTPAAGRPERRSGTGGAAIDTGARVTSSGYGKPTR
jgi:hypothetical protein